MVPREFQFLILGQTAAQAGTSNYIIESFDQTKFTATGSITVDNVGTRTALIRWGSNGLAFTTRIGKPTNFTGIGPGQLYVISGNFVKSSNSSSESSNIAPLLPVRRTWNLNAPQFDLSNQLQHIAGVDLTRIDGIEQIQLGS